MINEKLSDVYERILRLSEIQICGTRLLHAMLGGKYSPHQELNVRPQSGPASIAERLLTALKDKGWTDPYDDAVFEEVMHLITKRIGHNIRTVDMQWLMEELDGDVRTQDKYCTSCS